jgi:hypothetical protein
LAAFNAIVNAAVQEIRARQVSLDERIHCIKCSSLAAEPPATAAAPPTASQ